MGRGEDVRREVNIELVNTPFGSGKIIVQPYYIGVW
jgi:hypothetical protein